MVRSIWLRILCAATKPGSRLAWFEAVLFAAATGAAAAAIGFGTGLFQLQPETEPAVLLAIALIAFAFPALAEETVFRGWLGGRRIALVPSLAAFIAWHPAQLMLGLPWARQEFADPRFLAIAAILGAACTASRVRSGSLWPPVAIHWAVVVVWKGLTGG